MRWLYSVHWLLMLLALLWSGCDSYLAVSIQVQNAPAETEVLRLQFRHGPPEDSVDLPEQSLPLGRGMIWVKLPAGRAGRVQATVQAFNRAGCLLGTGSAQSSLVSPVTELAVPLQGSGQPSCPLRVVHKNASMGKVTSQPAGIDCGERCEAYFSQPITLRAQETMYAKFLRFESGCDGGTGLVCQVNALREPRTVVAVFQNYCSADGACSDPSPTSENLYAVAGISASEVWAVGDRGTAVRFDGTSWKKITTGSTCDLRAVSVLQKGTSTVVWAAGKNSCVLRAEFAKGATPTFSERSLNAGNDLAVLSVAVDESYILAAGAGLYLRRSPEPYPAGSWSAVENADGLTVTGIQRTGSKLHALVTSDGDEYEVNDGALSMPLRTIPAAAGGPTGLAAGDSGTLWSIDGAGPLQRKLGSWTRQTCALPMPQSTQLRALYAAPGEPVWVVGSGATIATCDPNSLQATLRTSPGSAIVLNAVTRVPGAGIYIVGQSGSILHSPTG